MFPTGTPARGGRAQAHMGQLKSAPASAAECAALFAALDAAAAVADDLEARVAAVGGLFGLTQAYRMALAPEAKATLQGLPRLLQQFTQLLRTHNDARPAYAKQFGRELMDAAAALHQRILDFQNKAFDPALLDVQLSFQTIEGKFAELARELAALQSLAASHGEFQKALDVTSAQDAARCAAAASARRGGGRGGGGGF